MEYPHILSLSLTDGAKVALNHHDRPNSLSDQTGGCTVFGVDALQTLSNVGFALLGAIGGLFLGAYSGRRASHDVQSTLRSDFDALSTSAANVASQCRDFMERSYQHAQRAAGHESNLKKREEQPQSAWTNESYMSHLEKGGASLPEVEVELGLTS